MSKYKHIFFDLDHTLWDYDANAGDALSELYDKYDFGSLELFGKKRLIDTFFEVNYELWDLYNRHLIHRAGIRERRFKTIFDRLGADAEDMPNRIEEEYIALAPTKKKVFPHVHEVLDYLNDRYTLHIITNGFNDIQATKLKSARLHSYFKVIITSETAGFRKPNTEIFELALSRASAHLQEAIMIGDNLDSDIQGAKNIGMDHVWFNPLKTRSNSEIQHEISNLIQLKTIL